MESILIRSPDEHFAKLFGSSKMGVIMARALLRSDPDAAARVTRKPA
jgi:hypothetical protein